MTGHRILRLACDYPGCAAEFERTETDITAVRSAAAPRGWSSPDDCFDLCGHHPELKGHRLVLDTLQDERYTFITSTLYLSRCAGPGCDWKMATPQHAPGWPDPKWPAQEWARHLPYEYSATCKRRLTAARRKERAALDDRLRAYTAAAMAGDHPGGADPSDSG